MEFKISEPVEITSLFINEENILKSLGVPSGKADDYLKGKIQDLIAQCIDISSPRASWSVFSDPQFVSDPGIMSLQGKAFQLNKIVTSALVKSTEIAIFIGTCGNQVESYSKQLMKDGQSLEGLIVDIIGSEIAESVADLIHNKIESEMVISGVGVTNRYSPGYCNWPVSDQQQLFFLLGDNNCGVQLNASSLMLPIKSVSGIIGIGKDVENRGYTCAKCDINYCLYRDKRK